MIIKYLKQKTYYTTYIVKFINLNFAYTSLVCNILILNKLAIIVPVVIL